MGFLGQDGVTALWNKVKATFGATLSVSGTTVQLKNGAATPVVLSQATIPTATPEAAGVMSAADKGKLDGVASGATANKGTITGVTVGSAAKVSSGDVAIPVGSTSTAGLLKLGTTAADAAAGDHSHSGYVPTVRTVNGKALSANIALTAADVGAATKADVADAVAAAQVGAAVYKGAAAKEADISGTAYKVGWYWVVSAAGTFCGEACEPGDMVFCRADKGSAFKASDFDVVQANIQEMTASEVEALLV